MARPKLPRATLVSVRMRTRRNPQPFDALVGVLALVTAVVVVGFAGAPQAATEPVIPVAQAAWVLSDEPLLVAGELVALPAGPRLCEAAACTGAALCVAGLDPHLLGRMAVRGAALPVVLRGAVGNGVLAVGGAPLRAAGCDLVDERVGWGGTGAGDVPPGGGGVPVLE